MPASQESIVCLRLADSELRSRWTRCLESAGFRCLAPRADGNELDVDLLVVDAESATTAAGQPSSGGRRQQGLIVIGAEDPAPFDADACLPLDALDREIVLASRLIAELARQRRHRLNEAERGAALAQLALTDSLTGVGNRRAWRLALSRTWSDLASNPRSICVGVFDLDHFKTLNDTLGHAAGDQALQIAGHVLASAVRKHDFAARLGGDEFGVLWVGLDAESAPAVVERVRSTLSQRLAAVGFARLTASAGFAVAAGPDFPDPDALVAQADQGLQAAKQCGRSRTRPAAGDPAADELCLGGGIERRVDAGPMSAEQPTGPAALFAQPPARVE